MVGGRPRFATTLEFEHKKDIYVWCRENMEVEVIRSIPVVSAMKTAGTKNCRLCMAEQIDLFCGFEKQKKKTSKTHNLLNSRKKIYSACSCKMWFLRLWAIGNEGTDETTS